MQRKLLAVGLICVVFLAGCGEPGPGVNGTDTPEMLDETPTEVEVDSPTDTEVETPTGTPVGNETTEGENTTMNETTESENTTMNETTESGNTTMNETATQTAA